MATMAHHLLAKTTTDEILNNFKTGSWTYGASGHGTNFLRTGTPADFPSPDAAFTIVLTRNWRILSLSRRQKQKGGF